MIMKDSKILMNIKKYGLWFFNSFIWLFILLFLVDIISKSLVVKYMPLEGEANVLIPYILGFQYIVNTRAAFGIGFNSELANRVVYIIIASAASIALILYFIFKYKKLTKYVKACLMMILVGAIGNLVDRIFYSPSYLGSSKNGVVDWILLFPNTNIFPFTFNIADASIVVSVIMLIVYLIIDEVKLNKTKKKDEPTSEGKVLSKEELERLSDNDEQ